MKKGYIYKITSPSGKIYIGQTINPKRRVADYKSIKRCKNQPLIFKSLKKYGWNNHIFEIIEEMELNYDILNEREIFWIEQSDSFNSGLNLTSGGRTNTTMSDETKLKMSKSQTGRKHTEESKSIMGKDRIGVLLTEEHKLNCSKSKINSRIIKIDEIEYHSIGFASRELGIPFTTIQRRLKSNKFPNYILIKEPIIPYQGHPAANRIEISAYIHKTGDYVGTYISIMDCALKLCLDGSAIGKVLNGIRTHTKGYTFKK